MINDLFNISGLNILVTGSSRGIGFTLAEGMGKCGANIILNAVNKDNLSKAVENLNSQKISAKGFAFDVSQPEAVKDGIEQIQNEMGQIDVLINNAGIQIRSPLEDFDYQDWQKVINVNLNSVFLVTKQVVKPMIERKKGKIINICSLNSEITRPTISAYTASKGALKNLTKSMAVEWAKHNIQANGIGPGYFSSEMTQSLVQDQQFSGWLCQRTPAGRWGNLQELLGAAVFLASPASSFVNGHILYVDGGMLSCI
jgi:gluconate 5-dehydrogenase